MAEVDAPPPPLPADLPADPAPPTPADPPTPTDPVAVKSEGGADGQEGKDGNEGAEAMTDVKEEGKDRDADKGKDDRERGDRDRDDRDRRHRDSDRRDRDRDRDRDRHRDRDHRDRDRDRGRYDRDRSSRRDRDDRYDRDRYDRDSDRYSKKRGRDDRDSDRDSRKSRRSSPSPERKYSFVSGWDVKPVGMETFANDDIQTNPALLSMLPPTAQQTRQARRLYVGNVPLDIKEEPLMEFFNKTMLDAKATVMEGNPILNVEINLEKNFAFMEFRTPEEASACIHFDGVTYDGHTLRIRRPKDYAGGAAALPGQPQPQVQVPDTPNKVFVGGIPSYFAEDQVQELLVAVGPLKHFNLIRDQSTGLSKGYAFCEWIDDETTDKACAALNGIQLGEKTLVVQRSNSALRAAAQQSMSGVSLASTTALVGGGIAPHPLNISAQHQGATGVANTITGASAVPTRVLLLLNMVTEQELQDDEEYEDIVADIEDECAKFGEIKGVIIPRPPAPGAGRVFVEFGAVTGALDAQAALDGRKFASRTVNAAFFSEEAYGARSFE